jgi:hypothetical protein
MTIRQNYNKKDDNKKMYPIDVFGIKKIGITTWLDEYYIPVTGKEYKIIYDNIVNIYIETLCIQENNNPYYWLGISNIKLASLMAHEVFNRLKLIKLKEAGYNGIVGKKEDKLTDFNFKLNKDIFNSLKYKIPSKKNRFKQYIRVVFYFFKAAFVRLYKKRTMCYNFGYNPDNMNAYICKNNMVAGYFYPSLLLNNDRNFKCNDDLTNATNQFILKVIEKYDCLNEDRVFFIDEIDEIFQKSNNYFLKNLKFIKKHKLGTLLAIGLGSPLHRTLIAAWRMSGQKVVGFSHGNNYATHFDDILIEHDGLSITSEVIVSSQGQKLMLQELVDRYRHKLKIAEINVVKDSHYKRLFSQLQKKNVIKKIKKIMLIGFPMNSFIYPHIPSNHSFSNLRLELNMVKCLKNYGYKVVYKAHPDRLDEVSGVFDGRVDEIVTDPFEDVYDSVDCVVFGHSSTTTFGFCLLTNKPMVLISTKDIVWHSNTKSLLEKRCRIVNAEVNNNDEINFDELELKKAIDDSVEQINYEIVQKYAF